MPTISATIITKNEEGQIYDCLQSLYWVDEIIVLDSGSRDETINICKMFTPHIFITDWPGFGAQKNRAIRKASCEWILSIDADEIITTELRREIIKAIKHPGAINGYEIPRLSSYCGQQIRHSGWWPDYVPRLFRAGKGQFSDSTIHEKLEITGPYGKLNNPLIHNSFRNLEQVLDKINNYSSIGAEHLYNKGKRVTIATAIMKGLWTFFRTYILKAGFLDGSKGAMLAISNAEGTYYKYLKLLIMHEKSQQ